MSGILLIDAEQPFANELVEALQASGCEVTHVDDGKAGLEQAKAETPDLIVLCADVPSGYSICNKIKKDGTLKKIPLIITAKTTPDTFVEHKKLRTRAEEYLIKPYTPPQLLEKMSKFIDVGGIPSTPPPLPEIDEFDELSLLDNLKEVEGEDALAGLGDLDGLDSLDDGAADDSLELGDDDLDALDAGSLASAADLSAEEDEALAGLDAPEPSVAMPPPLDGVETADVDEDILDEGDLVDDGLDSLEGSIELTSQEVLESEVDALAPLDELDDEFDLGSVSEGEDLLASVEGSFDESFAELETPDEADLADADHVLVEGAEPMAVEEQANPATAVGNAPGSVGEVQQTASLRRENTELKSRLVELETRLQTAENALQSSQSQLTQSQSSSSSTARDVLHLKEQLRSKDKELERLKDEIFENEKKILDVQESLERANQELQTQIQLAAEKDAELASLRTRAEALEAERDALGDEVEGRLRTAEEEREGLAQRLALLEEEKGKVEEQLVTSYERLKTEEALRERARKATEIALSVLSGEVSAGDDADAGDAVLEQFEL